MKKHPDKVAGNLIPTTAPPMKCEHCAVRHRALFQGIPIEQLEWTQRYRQNQYTVERRRSLFTEHDDHPFAYTLYSGWVMLSKTSAGGKRQVLRFALPGDFLGFQARLDGPMSYSAHAVTDIRVCAFPRKRLDEMMNESPDLAKRMAVLSARDVAFTQQLLVATHQSARERITSLLTQLYIRVQALGVLIPGSSEDSIAFPLSQDMLADALGMTPETVNRVLRSLREEGVLELKSRRLTMLDRERALALSELDLESIEDQALL